MGVAGQAHACGCAGAWINYSVATISRYCAQGHAGARAVSRLRITPDGTPGFSLATASALASIRALMSPLTSLIRSSRVAVRVDLVVGETISSLSLGRLE